MEAAGGRAGRADNALVRREDVVDAIESAVVVDVGCGCGCGGSGRRVGECARANDMVEGLLRRHYAQTTF